MRFLCGSDQWGSGPACKTQAIPLAEKGIVVVDPLANLSTIKDLVSDSSRSGKSSRKCVLSSNENTTNTTNVSPGTTKCRPET